MRQRKKNPRRSRGITLIESLATVLVLAIVLPAVMGGLSLSTRTAGYAKHKAEATALAEQKLSELVATGTILSNGAGSGDFGNDNPGYTWESTIADWQENRMQEVHVSVMWEDAVQKYQVGVSTLVLLPDTTATQPAAGGGL